MLTDQEINEIQLMHFNGDGIKYIARRLHISYQTVKLALMMDLSEEAKKPIREAYNFSERFYFNKDIDTIDFNEHIQNI